MQFIKITKNFWKNEYLFKINEIVYFRNQEIVLCILFVFGPYTLLGNVFIIIRRTNYNVNQEYVEPTTMEPKYAEPVCNENQKYAEPTTMITKNTLNQLQREPKIRWTNCNENQKCVEPTTLRTKNTPNQLQWEPKIRRTVAIFSYLQKYVHNPFKGKEDDRISSVFWFSL